tara:strand:- start:4952 stop:5086 length:135 start_codon:yes stop_codon:yes gene_type:complete
MLDGEGENIYTGINVEISITSKQITYSSVLFKLSIQFKDFLQTS